MKQSVQELIKSRRSVRTFSGIPLKKEDEEKLQAFVKEVKNPFSVKVEMRLLDVKEYGLTSPVVVGAEKYLAGKVKRVDNYEAAFGYSFEKACLFAQSLGIGTVMLAASLSRAAFERAMEVTDEEVLPVASPVGYPANKMSIRESLMRKALKADKRKDFSELFFRENFEKSLPESEAGGFAEPLEMLRWAASAVNGQPWRCVVCDDRVHFYEAKSMKDSPLGDIQKLDVGIGIAHFDMAREERGMAGSFVVEDPGIPTPKDVFYIATFVRG